ncbi:CHAP domain-containing protein [Conexibacter sp. JD483]|uniref:CHAP domain-containing protein n=1 Tax=unclassified Conexibacter TaxID=2627773 RepID=UPI00272821B3|nr:MULTISPECIES: CHAP domain-containing protein [unclassified Conexibacter]MDO8188232.1 CHAP domain-containing protein [Conexibacter sp. CPCC 205706]MDO8201899.1 CHAP domain-containing protein [Conexibacter sp. CPCC 205762]MDR9370802.1 CHAP domain-containing protein [Conexibacter sp. JD483]
MSLAVAIARIEELQSAFAPRDLTPVQPNTTGGASVPGGVTASASSANSFSNLLNGALGGNANPALATQLTAAGMPAGSTVNGLGAVNPLYSTGGVAVGGAQRMIALAQSEVGQSEFPPGSNDSPRIATYREATAGSGVGPWCAYFVSWLGQQAGTPLGESGQGFGRVDDVYAWAQSTGRAVPNGPGVRPNPGDLIVWDEHIGMVEQVLPDGRIQTIEGNSSDRVSRNVHEAGSALGYVRMS